MVKALNIRFFIFIGINCFDSDKTFMVLNYFSFKMIACDGFVKFA